MAAFKMGLEGWAVTKRVLYSVYRNYYKDYLLMSLFSPLKCGQLKVRALPYSTLYLPSL
jgi:hypothetical protein